MTANDSISMNSEDGFILKSRFHVITESHCTGYLKNLSILCFCRFVDVESIACLSKKVTCDYLDKMLPHCLKWFPQLNVRVLSIPIKIAKVTFFCGVNKLY